MFWRKRQPKPEPKLEYRFEPQPDITAYELSQLLSLLISKHFSVEHLNKRIRELPNELRRHFASQSDGHPCV